MERSEAIFIIRAVMCSGCKCEVIGDKCIATECWKAQKMAIEALSEEARKHGRWIESGVFDKYDNKYGRHDYLCSECQKPATSFVGGSEDWWCFHKPKFCPNCGAKMDEVSDGKQM